MFYYDRTQALYEAMKEDAFERIGAEEEPSVIEDVANYGADTGWGGFTYTTDCVEFYEAHEAAIWDMLQDDADNFGYDNPMALVATFGRADMADSKDGLANLLAWYALEAICRREVDG